MKKFLLFLTSILLLAFLLSGCKEAVTPYTAEDIIGKSDLSIKTDDYLRLDTIKNYDELEQAFVKYYEKDDTAALAFVKLEIIDYGDANFPMVYESEYFKGSFITFNYSKYTAVIEKICHKSKTFPSDIIGKEITVLRDIYIQLDNENNTNRPILCLKRTDAFPFVKGQEYYASVLQCEYNGDIYYMATAETYMVEDNKNIKEYDNFSFCFGEKFDYETIRKGILEKYEGMKFD